MVGIGHKSAGVSFSCIVNLKRVLSQLGGQEGTQEVDHQSVQDPLKSPGVPGDPEKVGDQ